MFKVISICHPPTVQTKYHIEELLDHRFQGVRLGIGYPAIPDHRYKHLLLAKVFVQLVVFSLSVIGSRMMTRLEYMIKYRVIRTSVEEVVFGSNGPRFDIVGAATTSFTKMTETTSIMPAATTACLVLPSKAAKWVAFVEKWVFRFCFLFSRLFNSFFF